MSKLKSLSVLVASIFFVVPALAKDVSTDMPGDIDNEACKNVVDIVKVDEVDVDSARVTIEGCGNEVRILQLKKGGVSMVNLTHSDDVSVTIIQN